jgi:hypothetical protein
MAAEMLLRNLFARVNNFDLINFFENQPQLQAEKHCQI